jgi:hypothetical protein
MTCSGVTFPYSGGERLPTMFVCVCVFVFMCAFVFIVCFVCVNFCVYVCVCLYIYIYVLCVWVYVCVCVCVRGYLNTVIDFKPTRKLLFLSIFRSDIPVVFRQYNHGGIECLEYSLTQLSIM